MTREAIKTRLAGPLIPQKTTTSNNQLPSQDDSTGPVLLKMDSDTEQNDSHAKANGCCPSRKKKSANRSDDNDDPSKSKGARFKHWFNESVLPTCLQRRQNGEGRVTRGPAVTERRETDIPICVRSQVPEPASKVDLVTPTAPPKHTKLASNATQYTKASSAASSDDSFNEPKHASVKMTRTVIPPPPEKRAARGAILRNKTAKPVVIPRAPESEVNLGTKQSIFSIGKRRRKGALPRPQTDMYKEVIPNNLDENPIWTKPP